MVVIALYSVVWTALYRLTASEFVSSTTWRADVTCKHLQARLGSIMTLPSDASYTNLSDENWSHTAWQRPSCIATPTCPQDVSQLVTILAASNFPFAIRSGGHSPNSLDANINTGVLISMHKLDQVAYDTATGHVTIGTGARWGTVYNFLDQFNLTVVGGRVMDVGVGGLTLGGGLSYLSDLYGLVCDNVVGFEVSTAPRRYYSNG